MAHSLFERLARIARAEMDNLHKGKEKQKSQQSFDETQTDSGEFSTGGQKQKTRSDSRLLQYYANLEIPPGSDLESVRKAWKKMVRKYHPDLHSADPEKVKIANEIVQGLNQAYAELEKHLS
ncbi:MAG: hypothetical protein DWQ05_09620 [Calditrichaeota bacterium]|nr:MAG: hypothetical protein DWQ05_09620 [Calditrichota bacterium]